MDQIVFLGMGETGSDIVKKVASSANSRKVRINGGGRICCACVSDNGQTLPENVDNIICCHANSVDNVFDALEESEETVNAIVVASLSEADKTLCLDTVAAVREYLQAKNRSFKVKGIFILPDNGTFEAVKDVFDTLWLVFDQTEAGKINVLREDLITSVSTNIYTRYLTLLAEKFDAEEKEAEAKAESKPLIGLMGYARAIYPTESIAAYCAYRGGCDIIAKLNLAIDREIYGAADGEPVSKENFRKEYIRLFEEKTENDPNGLFPQLKAHIMNETVTLDSEGEPVASCSDKVEDLLLIVGNLIKIFAEDRDIASLESYANGSAEEFIRDINALSVDVANEILVNVLPYSMSRLNQKNDGSVFGMISHEGGEIPEDRIFFHPVVSRYLLYRLSLRLVQIKNCMDITADACSLTEGFESESKLPLAKEYFRNAVTVSFAKVLGDRLERFIGTIDEYFASLTDVYKHFAEEMEKNADECVSEDLSKIYVSASRIAKEELFRTRVLSVEGQTAVTQTVFRLAIAQYCLDEDVFDAENRQFIGKDPGYSFEYNAFNSYKKFYTRSKDPNASVSKDIYTVCGTDEAFRELADSIRKAATPAGYPQMGYIWPISSVVSDACPNLGEILDCDVEASKTRAADKAILECYSTAYGVDHTKFIK